MHFFHTIDGSISPVNRSDSDWVQRVTVRNVPITLVARIVTVLRRDDVVLRHKSRGAPGVGDLDVHQPWPIAVASGLANDYLKPDGSA